VRTKIDGWANSDGGYEMSELDCHKTDTNGLVPIAASLEYAQRLNSTL
jgi:hypothetical protein